MSATTGRWPRRAARRAAGLLAGAGTALVALPFLAAVGLTLLSVPWPGARQCVLRPFTAGAARLTELERRRLARFLDIEITSDYGGRQALRYLAARTAVGLLGGLVLLAGLAGIAYGTFLLWGWLLGYAFHDLVSVVTSGIGGLFLLFLAVQGALGVAGLEARLARDILGPETQDALRHRIEELAASRAGVVEAVHDERRRIERDLHDGVQQRLVALGMLLGRARRSQDQAKARALLAQAHEESRQALDELREVAWRVYPTALDEAGLRIALETVAERSAIPVRLDYGLTAEPVTAVRTAAYFVVAEALTNALKHSGADRIDVALTAVAPGTLTVRVTDDGTGGADPAGGGLLGLARRVAALDGRLSVVSPPGGPTTVTAELPAPSPGGVLCG
ncbi:MULTISPECIES: sensor histidine kinase [Streptomyces]|uniref:sensor histidine kinase n=1 Tax=Streptomyces lycopersici TaxID=2974589 RepID=UPI0021CE6A7E|nr:histidine kinase [Streptomyces sp. NEAU-383]